MCFKNVSVVLIRQSMSYDGIYIFCRVFRKPINQLRKYLSSDTCNQLYLLLLQNIQSFLSGDVLTARANLALLQSGGHVAGVTRVGLQTRDVHAVQQLLGGVGAVDDVAEGRAKAVLALVHAEGLPPTLEGQLGAVEGGPPVVRPDLGGVHVARSHQAKQSVSLSCTTHTIQ